VLTAIFFIKKLRELVQITLYATSCQSFCDSDIRVLYKQFSPFTDLTKFYHEVYTIINLMYKVQDLRFTRRWRFKSRSSRL